MRYCRYSQDEFDNVESKQRPQETKRAVKAMEMKTICALFTDEPLSDEEWLANYRKKQQENQKVGVCVPWSMNN